MSETESESGPPSEFQYHVQLTPAQLKITYTALHSLRDDFGHEESDVGGVIEEVLAKLPDEHAIRAIQLDQELERALERGRPGDKGPEDERPPPAAA